MLYVNYINKKISSQHVAIATFFVQKPHVGSSYHIKQCRSKIHEFSPVFPMFVFGIFHKLLPLAGILSLSFTSHCPTVVTVLYYCALSCSPLPNYVSLSHIPRASRAFLSKEYIENLRWVCLF